MSLDGSGALHVVLGGARFHLQREQWLQHCLPPRSAYQFWDGALDQIPLIPVNGTVINAKAYYPDALEE